MNDHFPKHFEKNLYRIFGDEGASWYRKAPSLVRSCIDRWRLGNCRAMRALSINLIYFAESPDHGAVVLKIGFPHPELFTELEALALFGDSHICKCYDSDRENGATLLERLVPGHDLFSMEDRSRQVEIGAGLIARLPVALTGNESLPQFS